MKPVVITVADAGRKLRLSTMQIAGHRAQATRSGKVLVGFFKHDRKVHPVTKAIDGKIQHKVKPSNRRLSVKPKNAARKHVHWMNVNGYMVRKGHSSSYVHNDLYSRKYHDRQTGVFIRWLKKSKFKKDYKRLNAFTDAMFEGYDSYLMSKLSSAKEEKTVHRDKDFIIVRHHAAKGKSKTGFIFEVVPTSDRSKRLDDWQICPEPETLPKAKKLMAHYRRRVLEYKKSKAKHHISSHKEVVTELPPSKSKNANKNEIESLPSYREDIRQIITEDDPKYKREKHVVDVFCNNAKACHAFRRDLPHLQSVLVSEIKRQINLERKALISPLNANGTPMEQLKARRKRVAILRLLLEEKHRIRKGKPSVLDEKLAGLKERATVFL